MEEGVVKLQEMEEEMARAKGKEVFPEEPDKVAPEFVIKPKTYKATEGELAKFECRVKGAPRPKIQWYINNKPVLHVSLHCPLRKYTRPFLTV